MNPTPRRRVLHSLLHRLRRHALLLPLACALTSQAQDADLDALQLADTAPALADSAPAAPRNWKAYAEISYGQNRTRNDGATHEQRRLSLDLQIDHALGDSWRLIAADRLDLDYPAESGHQNTINTLKEAYLSGRLSDDAMLDLGRINVRNGVALGYNPTDHFRVNAARSIVSVNPASLKENRLGAGMVRGQWVWNGGSLSALYAPRLGDQPSNNAFNPDWGASNPRDRWLMTFSPKLSEQITPQLLLYHEAGRSPQLGLNISTLLNNATVAYLEWSGGRRPSSWDQMLDYAGLPHADSTRFRNHVATGLTYTTENKLSLTAEYHYNGSALDAADWARLPHASVAGYWGLRQWLRATQDAPTKESTFLYATWQDALINHLDLNAMLRRNRADGSRMSWLEARYHWDAAEVAVQYQLNSGDTWSEFGALAQQRVWQLLVRWYL